MSYLNKVMLIGRLGRDPEVRHLENGAAVAKFSVATTENYKDREGNRKEQTEWHDVVVWRALAEIAEKFLKKGALVYIEGKLTHRKWQDKDGNNRYNTEIVANNFRMLEKRDSNNSGGSFPTANDEIVTSNSSAGSTPPKVSEPTVSDAPEVEDNDDLPF